MNVLIIKYKKKRLFINLILGLVWVILGVFNLYTDTKILWYDYGYILAGVLYLGTFFWEYRYQYLTFTKDYLKENALFGKRILLKDISDVKNVFGDYILKTEHKKLSINMNLVHDDSKVELEAFINSIQLSDKERSAPN